MSESEETKISIPNAAAMEELRRAAIFAKKSRQSYYTEEYGRNAARVLDVLHEKKKDILVPAGDISLFTLRLKYYNGIHYLLDNLDPDGHYKELYDITNCRTTHRGLEFSVRKTAKSKASLADFVIVQPTWRAELQEFLIHSHPDDTFEREDIVLSDEDLTWINDQLAGMVKLVDGERVPLFFGEITDNKILLVRDHD